MHISIMIIIISIISSRFIIDYYTRFVVLGIMLYMWHVIIPKKCFKSL